VHIRTRYALPAAAAALSLLVTACGSKSADTATSSPGSPSASAAAPSTNPLTGLTMADAEQPHPVYLVKVPDTPPSTWGGGAAGQVGLGKADLITEELVEGGLCRLAALYYDKLPKEVGPVRSARLTDVGVAKPLNATIVTSGMAPVTFNGMKKAGVTFLNMNNPNIVRVTDLGNQPYDVAANLRRIGAEAKKPASRPHDYLPFGTKALAKGKPAKSVTTSVGHAACTDRWSYTGQHYVMSNSFMAKGDDFTPDTIIAATITTSSAPYRDPAGNPVPVSHFVGTGKALIFHGGQMVKATWVKPSEDSTVKFKDAAGKPLKIPAGRTWLDLVPGKGTFPAGSVSWGK